MIARPTTERLILECCHHLLEDVAPHVTSDEARQELVMIETILRNAAVRAAHEIAWMTEETQAVAALCEEAAAVLDGEDARRIGERAGQLVPTSRHLDDVVGAYAHASELLAAILAAAADSADAADLRRRAQEAIDGRLDREAMIMGVFEPTGRE